MKMLIICIDKQTVGNGKLSSPSKNNTVVHSARSHAEPDSLKTSKEYSKKKIIHEVTKDKLFSVDKEEDNSLPFGDDDNKKNSWLQHQSKPGVDVSEFYNPQDGKENKPSLNSSKRINMEQTDLKTTSIERSPHNI
jgi:hypothetical protein